MHVSEKGESVQTLDGVSFEVVTNEFITVIGPSGCGKTTLFNLASGLLAPSRGSVVLNGHNMVGVNPYIAYMFQQDALVDWRTLLDNVVLGQEFLGTEKKAARSLGLAVLEEFGLKGFEKKRPYELSGGMRQRAALLRTYLTDRSLLLLDEPFGSLDALTRLRMQGFLLDRWEGDLRTILFITHDVDEAILLGDRVLVLTARPARVKEDVRVDIPRPRHADTVVASESFVRIKRHLLGLLQEEIDTSTRRVSEA